MHENYRDGFGYGVSITGPTMATGGSEGTISHNEFTYNRHAIASNSPDTRFVVADNYFHDNDLSQWQACVDTHPQGGFTLRAVVRDVPIPARYGDEVSNLRVSSVVGPFALRHLRNFVRRVLGQYFVRDFNVATLELIFGAAFLAFGAVYALHWIAVRAPGQAASAGVVMAAALPVIIGVQLLLQAMNFDVLNVPTRPIHPYLRTLERIEAAAHAEAEAAADAGPRSA